jgi:uncharacterized membrane-anchored protein YjiN (DUF445 family)
MLDECYSKKTFLKNYYAFIDDVSENYKDYTDEDWKSSDEKLKKYTEECYEKHESDLTDDEKTEIWAKSLKYYLKKYGFNLKKFIEEDGNEISEKFKEEIDKLKNYNSEDFEKIFKDVFKDDLSNLIDSALEGLQEFGNQLKEELEKEK